MKFNFKKSDYTIYLIIGSLVFMVFFVTPKVLRNSNNENSVQEQVIDINENDYQIEDADNVNQNKNQRVNPIQLLLNIVFLALLGVLIYLFYKRNKGEDFAFVFMLSKKNKKTKQRFLQVTIYNLGRYSLGINSPTLAFYYKKDIKKYKITKVENQIIYPLTIPVKQGHRLKINIEKFYLNIPELEKYKTLKIIYPSSRGKLFKSNRVGV